MTRTPWGNMSRIDKAFFEDLITNEVARSAYDRDGAAGLLSYYDDLLLEEPDSWVIERIFAAVIDGTDFDGIMGEITDCEEEDSNTPVTNGRIYR